MTNRDSPAGRFEVSLEVAPKRVAATVVDWPGWSRLARTEDLAVGAVIAIAPRYAAVAAAAGETVAATLGDPAAYGVIERVEGGAGTEFGVPSVVTELDGRALDHEAAARLVRLLDAAWATLDRVAAAAPAGLRKGPRGGGRDRDRLIDHVLEAERAYAREIGLRPGPVDPGDAAAVAAMRAAMRDVLAAPSDGSPLAGRRWTTRYAVRRIAWHVLDHAWEIEDRTDPS